MKKMVCALLALLVTLLACAALADGPSLSLNAITYVNNPDPTDRLNLRTKPSADAVSLGKYYNGTSVTLLDAPKNGWAHVRIDPLEGYMDANYLTQDFDEVTSAMPTLIVSDANGATLRSQPSQSAKALCTFKKGSEVYNVQGVRADGWLHVYTTSIGGGFLRADQLTPQLSYHKDESSVPAAFYVYIDNPDPTDRLNLRAEPRADAVSLGKYYNGVQALVLGDAGNGYWHVRIHTQEGYMDAAYLSEQYVNSAQPVVKVSNARGTGVNVRSAPSASASYEYTAGNGEELTILGVRDDGWLHAQYYGVFGFVRGDLVSPEVTFEKR